MFEQETNPSLEPDNAMMTWILTWVGRSLLFLVLLYFLYLLKSAAGINLSKKYHAADFIKMPIKALMHTFKA